MEPYLLERYDRQIRISGWDQLKVSNSTILVAGVGATGCEVAKNLCLAGIGRLILVDNDVVELSNLNRQMLFEDSDIGSPKAVVAKERLQRINPYVRIEAYYEDLRKFDESMVKDVDVICSCLDNWATRRWLNSLAVELKKPLVDTAIEGLYGNVQVVIPGETACLECHGDTLIPKDTQLAECTLKRRRPEDLAEDLRKNKIEIPFELVKELFSMGIKTIYDLKYAPIDALQKEGSKISEEIMKLRDLLKPKLPAIQGGASVIAGIASLEVLKILHGGSIGKVTKHLIVYDGASQRLTKVMLKRREDCFVCGDAMQGKPVEVTVSLEDRVWDLKEKVSSLFGIPDPEIQYKRWMLKDEQKLSEINVKSDDILYIHTSRRYMPIAIKVSFVEDNGRA
ncbi:MAG: hypothetical protein B9J98_03025 [Candidatus Terraquivivens tikiterensis]|uniref:Ubiquitin-like domain-containing protein n=1 Tax=Candidatus Terraquivivens tikiterensis TaxID=1980982 RepID=A0A2R7Y6A1_9ARCH|nr:MAG: hypothetical protein B9J98_03025 [Candidatus Terraquivivens tikiterensis]